jgi:hypothetical protein
MASALDRTITQSPLLLGGKRSIGDFLDAVVHHASHPFLR